MHKKKNSAKPPIDIKRDTFLKNILFETMAAPSREKALKTVSKLTGGYFNADSCLIIPYDEKEDKFSTNYHEYISHPDFLSVTELDLNLYDTTIIKKRLFEEKQPLLISSEEKETYSKTTQMLINNYNVKSNISAPLFYQNEILGLISISTLKKQPYSAKDLKTLSIIAPHISFILHKLKTDTKLKQQVQKEELIRKITTNSLSYNTFDDAIYSIIKDVANIFDFNLGFFREYDEKLEKFLDLTGKYFYNIKEIPTEYERTVSSKTSKYIIEHYLKEDITYFEDSNVLPENNIIEKEIKHRVISLHLKSFVLLTLKSKTQMLGFILIGSTVRQKKLEEDEGHFLKFIIPLIFATMNLFILNKTLNKQREAEIIINKISENIDKEEVISYFLKQLLFFFEADNTLFLKYDQSKELQIENYYITQNHYKQQEYKQLCSKGIQEIAEKKLKVIAINKINEEITNKEIKEKLNKCTMSSFICNGTQTITRHKELGIFLLANKKPRTWSSNEIDLYNYLIDFFINKYTEQLQKIELEETRQSFIATLTHDLKSPIVACQKAIEAMQIMPEEVLLITMKEYLQDIYDSNEEILKLINSLLSVYHYESSGYQLSFNKFDLNKAVISSTSLLKHSIISKNCKITQKLEEHIPKVNADEGEIKRVILNLLTNALKHSYENGEIIISTRKQKEYVEFSIQNFGECIPKENITSVFEKFKTTKRITGAGLGLYLSKQIIEAHKGNIWVKSEEEKGTIFYFRIPV